MLEHAQELNARLGPDQRVRYRTLGIDETKESILKALDEDIWEEDGTSIEVKEALDLFTKEVEP